MSAPLVVLLVLLLLASLLAPVMGVLSAAQAARAVRARDWARGVGRGAAALALILIPAWLWACVYAEYELGSRSLRCANALGKAAYPAILEYRLRHPNAPLTAAWPAMGPQPLCEGSGDALPYVYVPVADLRAAARAKPPAIIAYCPRRHKHRWWAPHVLSHLDRYALDAQGAVHAMTEVQLLHRLREQGAMPKDQ